MVRVEHDVVIDRPVSEVFAYLTDPDSLPEWQAGVLEARTQSQGPMGVGTRIIDVRKFLGRRIESTVEVTGYEPDRRFDLQVVSGPIQFRVSHILEPVNGTTRLTITAEGEPGGFFKVAEPLVARQAKRQFENDYSTLKDLLETRGV